MTDNHDQADLPIDDIERLDDLEATEPVEAAVSVAGKWTRGATLSLAGGGVLLVAALRSLVRGKARAIPLGLAGAGLVRYGLGTRRSSEEEAPTFEPTTEAVESGTEGKETSDEASAAAGRAEDLDVGETGDVPDEVDLGEKEGGGSRVEFTEDEPGDCDEPRTKPDLEDDDAADPRRTGGEADESAEIDLSQSAMAEEASEAAGPSPEQAEPTQTDATEPEETPEEDAAEMNVDPDDEDKSQDESAEDEPENRSNSEDRSDSED